jgi:hypothetical protein
MFRLRFFTERAARSKNGHAAHVQTGVASASSTNTRPRIDMRFPNAFAKDISPMASKTSGTVSAVANQKRRRMSRNSAFSPSSWEGVTGSSAMPQIGQLPGASRTICGCMGHVHCVGLGAAGIASSSAMPHFEQLPGDRSGPPDAWGTCRPRWLVPSTTVFRASCPAGRGLDAQRTVAGSL